jgi:hypothetical protein
MNRRSVTPTFQSARRSPVGKPALRPCGSQTGLLRRIQVSCNSQKTELRPGGTPGSFSAINLTHLAAI